MSNLTTDQLNALKATQIAAMATEDVKALTSDQVKALATLQSGQSLQVTSTDPGSMRDFAAFAKQTGNELLSQETVGNDFVHVLKRR